MTEAVIRERIAELNDLLATSPFLADSGEQEIGTYQSSTQGASQNMAQAIDTARLRINYLIFDLEATKRENKYLRQMLQIRRPKKKDDNKSDGLDSF